MAKTKKQETMFTKEQVLASKRYSDRRDAVSAVLPNDFIGSIEEVDSLLEKFMKGKVK